jgi:hypothetical protein
VETQIEQLRLEALSAVAGASDAAALKEARVRYLGKTGSVSLLSEGMRSLSKEERPVMGKLLNDLRTAVTAALEEKENALTAQADAAAFASIDASLPGTAPEATRANSCSSKRKRRSAIPALVPESPGEPSPWRPPSEAARLAPSGMAFMSGFGLGLGLGSVAGLAISEAPHPAAQLERQQSTAHGETRQPQGLPGLALA